MKEYYLNSPGGRVEFRLPETWQVVKHALMKVEKATKSVPEMVREAIDYPIGVKPLSALVAGKKSVAVIVDDLTRPTPKKALVGVLLDKLREYGLGSDQVTIIVAVGTHRPLTDAEITATFGEAICRHVQIVNHDCHAADLVPVGILPKGGELRINRIAHHADLRIAIGSILPHPFAGFGAGPKLVLPGIAAFETIRRHHMSLMTAKGTSLGNLEANLWREEILEAARLAGLDFIVNTVFDCDEDVKAVVAGDFREAHLAGIDMCRKEMGVPFDRTADVTIASSFPYVEGSQTLKPTVAAGMITNIGGTLILYASGVEGGRYPETLLQTFDAAFAAAPGGDTRQLVLDYMKESRCIAPEATMDFNSALNITLLAHMRYKTVLVSPDADEKQAARLGFDYAASLQGAIDRVAAKQSAPTVNILPSGGLVLPVLTDGLRFEW